MKKRHTLLVLLALVLAVATALPSTWAYFTANARAGGGRTVQLDRNTEIVEEFADWTKVVTITTSPVTEPVHLRARAYSTYTLEYSGEGWTDGGDGWWYYDWALANPGAGTDGAELPAPAWSRKEAAPLSVAIRGVEVPVGEKPEDFDVTVVYETTPVQYQADGSHGSAKDADWNQKLTVQGGGSVG